MMEGWAFMYLCTETNGRCESLSCGSLCAYLDLIGSGTLLYHDSRVEVWETSKSLSFEAAAFSS